MAVKNKDFFSIDGGNTLSKYLTGSVNRDLASAYSILLFEI